MALRPEEFEGKTVRSLKTLVAKQIGVSRFRQRWLSEDHIELKEDDFATASDVQLLVLDYVQARDGDVSNLFEACDTNDVEQVDELLRKRVNPNLMDSFSWSDGQIASHMAARRGNVQCLALLLEAGADKDKADCEDRTAMHLASLRGHQDVVRLLLEANADTDLRDSDSRTALHLAAACGQPEVVELLLEAGADKDVVDSFGTTALHVANVNRHVEVAKLLKAELEQK